MAATNPTKSAKNAQWQQPTAQTATVKRTPRPGMSQGCAGGACCIEWKPQRPSAA